MPSRAAAFVHISWIAGSPCGSAPGNGAKMVRSGDFLVVTPVSASEFSRSPCFIKASTNSAPLACVVIVGVKTGLTALGGAWNRKTSFNGVFGVATSGMVRESARSDWLTKPATRSAALAVVAMAGAKTGPIAVGCVWSRKTWFNGDLTVAGPGPARTLSRSAGVKVATIRSGSLGSVPMPGVASSEDCLAAPGTTKGCARSLALLVTAGADTGLTALVCAW